MGIVFVIKCKNLFDYIPFGLESLTGLIIQYCWGFFYCEKSLIVCNWYVPQTRSLMDIVNGSSLRYCDVKW